jgi:secreted trypsin-like serine protease
MKRSTLVLVATVAAMLLTGSAGAITFGTKDTGTPPKYPQVGALIAAWDEEEPGVLKVLCSGTLIRETPGSSTSSTFLTAAHCVDFLPSVGVDPDEVFVTFDPEFQDGNATGADLIPGTFTAHPNFACCGFNDTHDIAVVELEESRTGAAKLPTGNFLKTLNLRREWFTAVGYGTVRDIKTGGPNAFSFDGIRRYARQDFFSLVKQWLKLSMNPSTGSGGTCYGDSGGPHFLRDTRKIVSITITGDAVCRATDVTYRLDTASARTFLDDFVALP